MKVMHFKRNNKKGSEECKCSYKEDKFKASVNTSVLDNLTISYYKVRVLGFI